MIDLERDFNVKPGSALAHNRIDEYAKGLYEYAQASELRGKIDERALIVAELCSVLKTMVNSQAVLSDGQLSNIHGPLRIAAGKFQADGWKGGEDIADVGAHYLLEIATYVNTCQG